MTVKLLFVDNSRTTRVTMGRILEAHGYTVVTAATGIESIDLLKQEDPFDVVIMDLYMPILNGYEAAKTIRDFKAPHPNKEVPIIALTASSDPQDKEVAEEAGMNAFVIKSSDHTALFSAIERLTSP